MSKELTRVRELIKEVQELPKNLTQENEFENYTNGDEQTQSEISGILSKRHENKNKILRNIFAFFKANTNNDSFYLDNFLKITFRPKEGIYNLFHIRNDEAWKNDRNSLILLLETYETELKEKYRTTNENRPFLDKDLFSSGLFWTLIALIGGFAYFLGDYKSNLDIKKLEEKIHTQEIEYKSLEKRFHDYRNLKISPK